MYSTKQTGLPIPLLSIFRRRNPGNLRYKKLPFYNFHFCKPSFSDFITSLVSASLVSQIAESKQLLDEVEHDSENYQGRGLCYLPKMKAEADIYEHKQRP